MRLQRFDMGHLESGLFILIVGAPESGVTTLILDHLNYNLDLPIGTAFPGRSAEVYLDKIPPIFVHPKPTTELLNALVARQVNASKKAVTDISLDPRAFLVFDESLSKTLQRDRSLKTLFAGHRRLNLSIIVGSRDPATILPETSEHLDLAIFFGGGEADSDHRADGSYALVKDRVAGLTRELLAELLRRLDSRHICLVLDLRSSCRQLEDRVFWYRADADRLRSFRICKPEYWVMSDRLRNASHSTQ